MNHLIRGQKLKLSDFLESTAPFFLNLQLDAATLSCDVASFGLDADYRLSDDAYMTFYNQPQTPCGGVIWASTHSQQSTFSVNLAKLDRKIKNIVLTIAIDGQGVMSQLKSGVLQVLNSQREAVAEFKIDASLFSQERAVMLVELYQKEGIWRLAAVAQGFNQGLDALIRHFGGEVAEANDVATPIPVMTTPAVSAIDLKKKIYIKR